MRKLMCLVLAISGLAMGCSSGSDGMATTDPSTEADGGGGGNGGGNGAPNGGGNISVDRDASAGGDKPAYPDCDSESVLMTLGPAGTKWTGEPPWTQQDLMACQTKCSDGSLDCFQMMCDKGDKFVECFTNEIGVCAAGTDKAPCFDAWEEIACCTDANNCLGSQMAFDACIGQTGPCGGAVTKYSMCAGSKCQTPAARKCVSAGTAGGGTMMSGAKPIMIPAEMRSRLINKLH